MKNYKTYQDYLDHQASKMKNHFAEVFQKDLEYQKIIYDRYSDFFSFQRQTVLCLGARLGGEVKAFKRMGAVAIGIDIEPGEKNHHVLYGDFHDINFPDQSFDFIFSNCIDHVYNLQMFLSEIHRLLKSDIGIGIIELAVQEAGEYETIDTRDPEIIIKQIRQFFKIKFESPIDNGWHGKLLILKK